MTKCTNDKCPIRHTCKRFVQHVMPDNKDQKLFEFTPVKNADGIVVGYVCNFQKRL